jgi:hypothetical protein
VGIKIWTGGGQRGDRDVSLFRSSWYLSRIPFNEDEKPLMEVPSPDYTNLIAQMKSQKHIIF